MEYIAGGGRRRTLAPSAAAGAGGRRDDREEDLTLFKDMFRREKDRNVSLLQPVSTEFEQPYNGIYPYPLYRIPSGKQGLTHDLLPEEQAERNDYDWLKTPPATPLFPSLEMEASMNRNLVLPQTDQMALLRHPRPASRFAGKKRSEEPRPVSRQKHPAAPPRSTASSSRTSSTANIPAPSTASNNKAPRAAELKRDQAAEGIRRPVRPPPRGREEVAAPAAAAAAADGVADVGTLVLGSRMVEKVVNARRAAAAAEGEGRREKGVKPKGGGLDQGPPGRHGSQPPPPPRSYQDMAAKHAAEGRRKLKPASYVRQRLQEDGCPKSSAPPMISNRPAPAPPTPRETPGHESKDDRIMTLVKKGTGRRRRCTAMC